ALASYSGVEVICVNWKKIADSVEPLLARFDSNGVEDIAGSDQNFPPDHFVLRARIARDVDALDERALAFLNFVGDVDQSAVHERALRNNFQVDITTAAISVL